MQQLSRLGNDTTSCAQESFPPTIAQEPVSPTIAHEAVPPTSAEEAVHPRIGQERPVKLSPHWLRSCARSPKKLSPDWLRHGHTCSNTQKRKITQEEEFGLAETTTHMFQHSVPPTTLKKTCKLMVRVCTCCNRFRSCLWQIEGFGVKLGQIGEFVPNRRDLED